MWATNPRTRRRHAPTAASVRCGAAGRQPIHLTDTQRDDLEEIARSNALPAGFVQRAKIVVLLADGVSARAVETKLDV